MATNSILPFCSTDTGTNLLTDAQYTADAQRTIGHQPGVARAELENKALRGATLVASAISDWIALNQGANITDSVTKANLALYLESAISNLSIVTVTPPTDANYTLTSAEEDADVLIVATGAWTVARNIITSTNKRAWTVISTSTYAATVKTSAGSGIAVSPSTTRVLINNGTDVIDTLASYYTKAESNTLKISGDLVQSVFASTNTFSSSTAVIPADDTIPQSTEGVEVVTVSITPKSASNKLRIRTRFFGGVNASVQVVSAIFQDATANAIVAGSASVPAGGAGIVDLVYEMPAGTTSTTTFKMRAGPGTAATMYINGAGGARQFGGVLISSITVEEVAV